MENSFNKKHMIVEKNAPLSIHANFLRLGKMGILICGESASGKSVITLSLIERAQNAKKYAKLISDDYTKLTCKKQILYGSCPKNLRGGIEIRGAGLYKLPSITKNPVDFVVQLGNDYERLPTGQKTEILGVKLPLYKLPNLQNADCVAICHAIEAFCFGTIWKKSD